MSGGDRTQSACGACVLRAHATSAACLRCETAQLLTGGVDVAASQRLTRRSRMIALACLIATAACWGSAFQITEVALTELKPLELTFLRCMIGAIVICAAVALRPSPAPTTAATDPARRRVAWRTLLVGGVLTGIAYATVSLGQVGATSTTTGVVLGTVPVWAALLSGIVSRGSSEHRGLTGRALLALMLGTFAAVIPAIASPAEAPAWAVGLLLVAALSHAGSMVTIQPAVLHFGPLRGTAGLTILAALFMTPAWLIGPTPDMPSGSVILAVIALGVLPTGLAYVFFFEAVRRLGARTAALAVYLIPGFALTVGWLTDPRLVGPAVLTGAACGAVAVALGVLGARESVANATVRVGLAHR